MTFLVYLFMALALGSRPDTPAVKSPDPEVLELALEGYELAVQTGKVIPMSMLTIIDYSQPSTEHRLFIYDPDGREVIFSSLVAHGKNSGQNMATSFGNKPGSLQSSLGFFATGDTYHGRHGYSLRLYGLEPGINDNAFERAIVIHGADYVSEDFATRHGRLGRSWGCPALPQDKSRKIIDFIKGGSCVFIYGEDSTYLEKSVYIGMENN